jgi:DNA-binding transcriptional LysR family regulator
MLDRLTGMQVFVRVAALGGLSAAARSLNISPTLATKHIAALEERLGVKLLHRSTRRLTLTEAGRRYLDGVEKILVDVDEVEASAGADRVEVRGTLRINAPLSFGFQVLAPLMVEFSKLHPAISIDLGLNDRVVDLIEEGWDVALRIGQLKDTSMVARKLADCRMVVCAAPSYLAEHGTPTSVAALAGHNCLGYTLSRPLGADRWTFGAAGEVTVPITGNMRASNGDALVAAAVAGHGVTYQPTFLVAEALKSGQLVPLVLDHPPIELHGIFSVFPANRRQPAKVRAFVDFLVEKLAPEPTWDRDIQAMLAGEGREASARDSGIVCR